VLGRSLGADLATFCLPCLAVGGSLAVIRFLELSMRFYHDFSSFSREFQYLREVARQGDEPFPLRDKRKII
jgi:hypothetical protein